MTRLQRLIALLLVAVLGIPVPLAADEAKSLYNKGRNAEARENYEAAYDFYYKAFDLKPNEVNYRSAMTRTRFLASASYVHKGQQLRNDGKLDEALIFFEKALVIDPSSFVAEQEIKKTKEMIERAKTAPASAPTAAAPDNSLRRRAMEAEGPVELGAISPTPITLKLTEDSKVIYQTIGKLAGLNVLFDPDYTSRRISIELNGVTLNEALDIVALESKTFWRPVTANTIFIATDTAAKRKELEQSVVKTFYLSNISQPTELQDMVNAMRTILEVSRIQQLPTQSAIVIRGTPDQVALAEKLVGDIDRAKPEVLIDVVVMQVSRDKVRDLGIQPPASASVAFNSVTTNSTTTSGTTTGSTGTPNQISLNDLANLHATNFTVTIPGATANFLFTDAKTRIIQKPQIRASDGQKASLKIGERVPVATGSFQPGIGGVGINPLVNTQFQYIDVGVNIDITPKLHANREVSLKVMVDISSVTSQANIGGIQQPVIGQRKIEHEIRLKEGEVNLLGGILEDQDIKNLSGIPGLANIPILKYLFADNHVEKHQNEIVFALVPHIVRAYDISDLNERAIDVGTATGIDLRRRPTPPPAPVPTSQAAPPPPAGTTTLVAQQPATAVAPSPAPAPAQTMQTAPAQTAPAQATPAPAQTMPGQPQQGQNPADFNPMPPPRPTQPGTVAFSFDPMNINQAVGQTFAVNVVMTGAESIHSVPLQITYDSQMLQLVNVSNGPFLSRDQQPVALVHRDDPVAGILNVNAVRPPDSGGISGDGVVFTLTFQAKAAGHAALAIARPSAKNVYKQAVPGSATQAMVTVK